MMYYHVVKTMLTSQKNGQYNVIGHGKRMNTLLINCYQPLF